MDRGGRTGLYIIITLALIIAGIFLLRFELPVISVAPEKLPVGDHYLQIGPIAVTNSLLTSWVVMAIIIVLFWMGTRNLQLVPSGLQNLIEMIVESLYNLVESVSGPKWAPRFFLIPATIFIYVLFSNLFGLLPGLAGIGFCAVHHTDDHAAEEAVVTEEHAASGFRLGTTCPPGEEIVPLFRSPSADLNNTLMLALVTQLVAWFFGITALGVGGFLHKFLIFDGIAAAFQPDAHGNRPGVGGMLGKLAMGLIDFFVGLLEGLSEFIKIIAFTFRLFGNIFAGEVMLVVLGFLVPLGLTIPFLGFEVFVAFIQAFIFFILSVAFYTIAITGHGHEEEHH